MYYSEHLSRLHAALYTNDLLIPFIFILSKVAESDPFGKRGTFLQELECKEIRFTLPEFHSILFIAMFNARERRKYPTDNYEISMYCTHCYIVETFIRIAEKFRPTEGVQEDWWTHNFESSNIVITYIK
jgi:hypothetical protein